MNIVVLTVLALLGVTLFYQGRGFGAWVTPGALGLIWWGAAGLMLPLVTCLSGYRRHRRGIASVADQRPDPRVALPR